MGTEEIAPEPPAAIAGAMTLLADVRDKAPQWKYGTDVGRGADKKTRTDWLMLQVGVVRGAAEGDLPGDPDWGLAATWIARAAQKLWPAITAEAMRLARAEVTIEAARAVAGICSDE